MAEPSFHVFETAIGWIGFETGPAGVRKLVFGHRTQASALTALGTRRGELSGESHALAARLCAYASGDYDDFRDVAIDHGQQTPFCRRVLDACRQIPPGQTISYADLAGRAGSPRAARAVGQVMASNRVPIVIPCHRVVASGGRLGGFSAPGGLATKERLLRIEAAWASPVRISQHTFVEV